MKRKFMVFLLAVICLFVTVLVWDSVRGYVPSESGSKEEGIALEDMRRYCKASNIDCTGLRIEARHASGPIPLCKDSNGKPDCEKSLGFWSFVIQLQSGKRYEVAVLPTGSMVIMSGLLSEIVPLEPNSKALVP